MFSQLGPKRSLDQGLLQMFEQPILAGQVFGLLIVSKQLIKKFGCYRRRSHVSLLDKVNSQKPAYTSFRTPSENIMNACTRRAFLSFAPGAVATAAIGIVGANFIEVAEALEVTEVLPTAADSGQRGTASPL